MKTIFVLLVLGCASIASAQSVSVLPLGVSVSAIPSSDERGEPQDGGSDVSIHSNPRLNLALGSYAGLAMTDAIYSAHLFASHPNLREGSIGRGMEHQPLKFIATKATMLGATILTLRLLERQHPKLAKVTTWTLVGLEGSVLAHNYMVTR